MWGVLNKINNHRLQEGLVGTLGLSSRDRPSARTSLLQRLVLLVPRLEQMGSFLQGTKSFWLENLGVVPKVLGWQRGEQFLPYLYFSLLWSTVLLLNSPNCLIRNSLTQLSEQAYCSEFLRVLGFSLYSLEGFNLIRYACYFLFSTKSSNKGISWSLAMKTMGQPPQRLHFFCASAKSRQATKVMWGSMPCTRLIILLFFQSLQNTNAFLVLVLLQPMLSRQLLPLSTQEAFLLSILERILPCSLYLIFSFYSQISAMIGPNSAILLISQEMLFRSVGRMSLLSLFSSTITVLGYCYLMLPISGSMCGSTMTKVNLSRLSRMLLPRLRVWLYYCTNTLYFLLMSSTSSTEFLSTQSTITPPSSLCLIHYRFAVSSRFPSMLMFECRLSLSSDSCWFCCNHGFAGSSAGAEEDTANGKNVLRPFSGLFSIIVNNTWMSSLRVPLQRASSSLSFSYSIVDSPFITELKFLGTRSLVFLFLSTLKFYLATYFSKFGGSLLMRSSDSEPSSFISFFSVSKSLKSWGCMFLFLTEANSICFFVPGSMFSSQNILILLKSYKFLVGVSLVAVGSSLARAGISYQLLLSLASVRWLAPALWISSRPLMNLGSSASLMITMLPSLPSAIQSLMQMRK